jgi:hypothetical protein
MIDIIDVNLIWGIILVSVTLKCWVGQIIIAFSPKVAVKIKIAEAKSDVDSTFFADMRSQAIWDAFSLWTLPVTGVLLIMNNNLWIYFGLIGGSMYLYFVGRGITSRLIMKRRGINIGKSNLKVNLVLTLWGFMAIVTIIMAVMTLT